MPSDIAISVKNLTKTYRIFGHPGDRIKQALTLGRLRLHQEFTALNNVTFDIKKGDIVGIIGRNGSGKSTLLQLICGILKPTSGTVEVNGRVSALLELGAGFNPEFTGRENIIFQSALLGLHKSEINSRLDNIAAFADIGKFLDQPVRIYSSGMFLRLAFAVAVHMDPEILVVDEALAVGDEGFRSRCFQRIGELRTTGCTILFVSHAMGQIVRLCNQAMLIDEGVLLCSGQSKFVAEQFQRLLRTSQSNRQTIRQQLLAMPASSHPSHEYPTTNPSGIGAIDLQEDCDSYNYDTNAVCYDSNGALIESVKLCSVLGQQTNLLHSGERYRCSYVVLFTEDATHIRFAMLIKTLEGFDLGGAMSATSPATAIPNIAKGMKANVEFEFDCRLNPGKYHISVAVFGGTADIEFAMHGIRCASSFRVVGSPEHLAISSINFCCTPSIQIIETTSP